MKCCFNSFSIKPDGINELNACQYEESEIWKNVTVQSLKCKKCGNISIGWYKISRSE